MVFMASFATAQAGGGIETIHQYEGTSSYANFGGNCGFLGDVNGDGHDDFFIGNSSATINGVASCGEVWVRSGIDGSVLHYIAGTQNSEWVGREIEYAGDVDGDGCDDFSLGRNSPIGVDLISGASGTLLHHWPLLAFIPGH